MNLYVDTQVPVALSGAMVTKSGDLVTAEGTWVRTDLIDGTIANPLQTSRIECNKQENRCTEAKASVSGTLLSADLVEYEVESWTAASIVFRNDALCATEVFTIDLNTDAVSGAGRSINEDTRFCKMYSGTKRPWHYRLSNGFEVYWGQRKQARPLPLRLIQSIFDN